jgi:hypothetical protein
VPYAHPPSWRTSPFRLSATAYSIHSQLPSISIGRLLHPQPEDATRDTTLHGWLPVVQPFSKLVPVPASKPLLQFLFCLPVSLWCYALFSRLYSFCLHGVGRHISRNILSWFMGVTIDGVWTGEWIYWPLVHRTRNYKHLQRYRWSTQFTNHWSTR